MIVFVSKGSGLIVVDDNSKELKKGDVILIQPNEKYYWNGILELIVSCTPTWSPEQMKFFN